MGRGFLSGLIWGLVVSLVAAAVASLLAPGPTPQDGPAPETAMLEAPADPAEQAPEAEVPAVSPAPEEAEPVVVAPAEPQTAPEEAAPDAEPVPDPAPEPVTAPEIATPEMSAPEAAETPDVAAMAPEAAEEPAQPGSVAEPQAPGPEALPTVDTPAASPEVPEAMPVPAAPEADVAEAGGVEAAEEPAPARPALPQVIAPDSGDSTPAGDLAEKDVPPAPVEVSPEAEEAEEAEEDEVARLVPGQPPSIRAPVGEMPDLAPNVRTGRLPSISAAPVPEEGTEEAEEGATEAAMPKRALDAYAAPFENPDLRPLLSVILIDDPDHPVPDAVLADLPFPASFAVDATRGDAAKVAARYRAAGFDVLMLTNLPRGATPSDVEVALEAYKAAIPQAVGLLDTGDNGFQASRKLVTQVSRALAETGHGLVTLSKGLNAAQQVAEREGVPAALVFRQLDSDGEAAAVVRRYLDRAAFRAGQEGYAIMLGHTRPETIEGLVMWTLEDRSASVVPAPVSAVLKTR